MGCDKHVGITPLYNAASQGHVEVAECLGGKAAIDVMARASTAATELRSAAASGSLEVVECLFMQSLAATYGATASQRGCCGPTTKASMLAP